MAGFKSFLSAVGHDAKAVWDFIASPKGQNLVNAAEGAAAIAAGAVGGPGAASGVVAIEGLINRGYKGLLTVENLAAAAGASNGTGAQKAVLFSEQLAPQASAVLQNLGVKEPTADEVEKVTKALADGLSLIVNALPAPASQPAA